MDDYLKTLNEEFDKAIVQPHASIHISMSNFLNMNQQNTSKEIIKLNIIGNFELKEDMENLVQKSYQYKGKSYMTKIRTYNS